jgi:hypothetical protein
VTGVLDKMVEKNVRRQRDGFSISGIGNCAAQQLFGIAGFPSHENPPTGRMLLTWRSGNMHEDELIEILEVLGGETIVGKQKEFIGADPPRVGHIDGLWLLGDKLYIFDAKSSNDRGFNEWLAAGGISKYSTMKNGVALYTPRDKPNTKYRPCKAKYESYYYQAQGYMQLVNSRPEYQSYRIDNMALPPEELAAVAVDGAVPIATDGFFFVVYCKDNSSIYLEWVPYDEAEIEERLAKLKGGLERVQATTDKDELTEIIREYKEIPMNEDGKLHWKCARCPFANTCWSLDDE